MSSHKIFLKVNPFLRKSTNSSTRLAAVNHKFYATQSNVSTEVNTSSTGTEGAQYPPIEEISPFEVYKCKHAAWHKKVQDLPTIEQKLIELNMPKYYGYKTWIFNDAKINPEGNNLIRYSTRTHVIKGLPEEYYSNINVDQLVEKIKPKIEELIYLHHYGKIIFNDWNCKATYEYVHFNKNFNLDLNNLLLRTVQEEGIFYSPTAVDIEPRIEAFWNVGGFEVKESLVKLKEKQPLLKRFLPEFYNMHFRGTARPTTAVRTKLGLPEVVPMNSSLASEGEIPLVQEGPLNPARYGFPYKYKRACYIPGFWPGPEEEHSQVFIYPRIEVSDPKLIDRRIVKKDLVQILSENKAIIAGFTQALSYAFYQGFTHFNDVTYPFTNQSVATDGKNFQFFVYQMNTCKFFDENAQNNPRNNIMWISEDEALFDRLEGATVKGLNEDVLKKLLRMYVKKGIERENTHPYLAPYKYLMHHQAPKEYKDLFRKKLIKLMVEKIDFLKRPYITQWEKIYKIYFNTRPMDIPRKWFESEKAINPMTRRLDEYQLEYIPRYNRINPKIRQLPRINSEHLFVHDFRTLRRASTIDTDDDIAFKTLNILPNSDRYRSGFSDRKWRKSKKILHQVDPEFL